MMKMVLNFKAVTRTRYLPSQVTFVEDFFNLPCNPLVALAK